VQIEQQARDVARKVDKKTRRILKKLKKHTASMKLKFKKAAAQQKKCCAGAIAKLPPLQKDITADIKYQKKFNEWVSFKSVSTLQILPVLICDQRSRFQHSGDK
jgi:hypothetical protein